MIIKTYLTNKCPVTFEDFTEALDDRDRLILQTLIGEQLCCLMLHASHTLSHALTCSHFHLLLYILGTTWEALAKSMFFSHERELVKAENELDFRSKLINR